MDKSLFFLFLAFICVWLVLDNFYGNKYIKNGIDSLLNNSDPVSNPKTGEGNGGGGGGSW